jgi:hypothetical protein
MFTPMHAEALRGQLADAERNLSDAQADVDGWRDMLAYVEANTPVASGRHPYPDPRTFEGGSWPEAFTVSPSELGSVPGSFVFRSPDHGDVLRALPCRCGLPGTPGMNHTLNGCTQINPPPAPTAVLPLGVASLDIRPQADEPAPAEVEQDGPKHRTRRS